MNNLINNINYTTNMYINYKLYNIHVIHYTIGIQ